VQWTVHRNQRRTETVKVVSGGGIDSVIVGKALYEGRFTLAEALQLRVLINLVPPRAFNHLRSFRTIYFSIRQKYNRHHCIIAATLVSAPQSSVLAELFSPKRCSE
jgi:hypothetical protein